MIIKVCGLKEMDNLQAISSLDIDMIGLNFYKKSKRHIGRLSENERTTIKNTDIGKAGVFVNSDLDHIKASKDYFGLEYIQLHGDENIAFCKEAKAIAKVIKVFGIDSKFDFGVTQAYDFCDLFLFDTKAITYGGTGKKFSWNKLEEYKLSVPFLLAGGIGPKDITSLQVLTHPQWIGIDINSKFEKQPGIKDIDLVKDFSSRIKLNSN